MSTPLLLIVLVCFSTVVDLGQSYNFVDRECLSRYSCTLKVRAFAQCVHIVYTHKGGRGCVLVYSSFTSWLVPGSLYSNIRGVLGKSVSIHLPCELRMTSAQSTAEDTHKRLLVLKQSIIRDVIPGDLFRRYGCSAHTCAVGFRCVHYIGVYDVPLSHCRGGSVECVRTEIGRLWPDTRAISLVYERIQYARSDSAMCTDGD